MNEISMTPPLKPNLTKNTTTQFQSKLQTRNTSVFVTNKNKPISSTHPPHSNVSGATSRRYHGRTARNRDKILKENQDVASGGDFEEQRARRKFAALENFDETKRDVDRARSKFRE